MRSLLAVVDGTERTNHTLRAAVERAAETRARLVVVNVTSQSEYQDKRAAVLGVPGAAGERYEWTVQQAQASAADAARRQTRRAVGDRDLDWTAVGTVGTPRRVVLDAAAEHGCDEVVVAESKPRWFGLRRSFDGRLAAAFDGTVTPVSMPAVGSGDGVSPVPETEV